MDMAFLKVLNMSISASWLVLVVLALRFLLKKSPRWVYVCLWALVAVRLVCPFSLESDVSLIPENATQQMVETISGGYYGDTVIYSQGSIEYDSAVAAGISPSVGDNGYHYVLTQADDPTKPVQTVAVLFGQIWVAGIVLMLLYAMFSYTRLKRKVSASIDLGNGIFLCDYIDTPFILGIICPKIFLPSSMEPDSASHVLAHERAHIARRDHWWKPLGYLLLTVHWFNPIMWLAYILLCRDIELACDEKVVGRMALPERKSYSDALLACSVKRLHVAACPLAFGEVGVKERVKSVLNYKKPTFWLVLVAIIALVVTAVCFLTDPVERFDSEAAAYFEEYAYENVAGRMEREEVVCLDAREGFALVYSKGMGPTLKLYQYEKIGGGINVLSVCSGDYTISGGMSLNHLEADGKHIYFGTVSKYHYNPMADLKTTLNWDYLSITDTNGKTHKQDMTGKEGFLFILDAPLEDFHAVDVLDTVCLNVKKFTEQGYSIKETYQVSIAATESPFGKYYRAMEMDYEDYTSVSYLGVDTKKLYLLTEGNALLSLDAMDWSQVSTVARLSQKDLPEDFADLFLKDPDFGAQLRDNNIRTWEYWEQQHMYQNDRDVCYLLQQKDGSLYLVIANRWVAQYREGESKICHVYKLEPVSTDDPYAESSSPYQWTLNLRSEHVQQVQMTVYDEEGVPQRTTLGQRELSSFMQIINSLTKDQISLGRLQRDHTVTAYVGCVDENGWNADLDVLLQYDGSAVRMVFTTEGAERYSEEKNKAWIIRSDALNEFMSVYTYKKPEEDPFSDPDNAYRWCHNISLPYLEGVLVSVEEGNTGYLGEVEELEVRELLRILKTIPESGFEKAELPETFDMQIYFACRNMKTDDWNAIGVTLRVVDDAVYYTQSDGTQYYQTWKISSHALVEFIREQNEEDKSSWTVFTISRGQNPAVHTYDYETWETENFKMSIRQFDCFEYAVSEDGIRFKPEDQEGWILVQYCTEPFAVCGTGLETSTHYYTNMEYTADYGYYDGSTVWSFVKVTTTAGDVAHEVVFLNENAAPWVTEYNHEISVIIGELNFLVGG